MVFRVTNAFVITSMISEKKQYSPAIRYLIGLGANIGDPMNQIMGALQKIAQLAQGDTPLMVSSIYRTQPWGEREQPDFLNAVCLVTSHLAPEDLLEALLAIEAELGRTRDGKKWGPRLIDLDILWSEKGVVRTENLSIPHPHIAERDFVLVPMHEIAPEVATQFIDPRLGLGQLEIVLPRAEVDARLRASLHLDS